jgi:hypothetical protein
MSLITTVDHAYAAAAKDVVSAANFVQSKVLPVLKNASTQAATIEAITSLVSPAAANVERAAFAVLGTIIKSIEAAGAAAVAGGLNVQLDAALIADVKSIIPAVKSQTALPTGVVTAVKPS